MLLSFIRLRFWEHDNRGRSKRTKLRETAEAGGARSKGQTFWGGTGRWLRFLMSVAEAFPGTKQEWIAHLSQMCLRIQDVSPVWFLIARKCSSSCECHLTSLTKMPTTNKSLPSAWRSYSGTLPEQMWHNNNCEICSDSVCSFLLKLTWNIWLKKQRFCTLCCNVKQKKADSISKWTGSLCHVPSPLYTLSSIRPCTLSHRQLLQLWWQASLLKCHAWNSRPRL